MVRRGPRFPAQPRRLARRQLHRRGGGLGLHRGLLPRPLRSAQGPGRRTRRTRPRNGGRRVRRRSRHAPRRAHDRRGVRWPRDVAGALGHRGRRPPGAARTRGGGRDERLLGRVGLRRPGRPQARSARRLAPALLRGGRPRRRRGDRRRPAAPADAGPHRGRPGAPTTPGPVRRRSARSPFARDDGDDFRRELLGDPEHRRLSPGQPGLPRGPDGRPVWCWRRLQLRHDVPRRAGGRPGGGRRPSPPSVPRSTSA